MPCNLLKPGAKENTSRTPIDQAIDKRLRSQPTKMISFTPDARPTGVQLKKAALLSTMNGLKTKYVADFNVRNKCLTAKLLKQGYRFHKLQRTFSEYYRRHCELIFKCNVGLKTLLRDDLLVPEFYVGLQI